MNGLISHDVQCPYCGELFEILVDSSVARQQYIEDCEVCCRPINFDVSVDEENEVMVSATHENE